MDLQTLKYKIEHLNIENVKSIIVSETSDIVDIKLKAFMNTIDIRLSTGDTMSNERMAISLIVDIENAYQKQMSNNTHNRHVATFTIENDNGVEHRINVGRMTKELMSQDEVYQELTNLTQAYHVILQMLLPKMSLADKDKNLSNRLSRIIKPDRNLYNVKNTIRKMEFNMNIINLIESLCQVLVTDRLKLRLVIDRIKEYYEINNPYCYNIDNIVDRCKPYTGPVEFEKEMVKNVSNTIKKISKLK